MPFKDRDKQRAAGRKYQQNNSEKYKIYLVKRREKSKFLFKVLLKDMTCCVCPENKISTFDFHHLDPSQKEENIGDAKKKLWLGQGLIEEICKCAVLCANCHRKFHADDLTCEEIQKISPINREHVEKVFREVKTLFNIKLNKGL